MKNKMVNKSFLTLLTIYLLIMVLFGFQEKDNFKLAYSMGKIIGINEPKTKAAENYIFYNIGSVDCDKNGNIYVLDRLGYCVKVFDKYGKFVKKLFKKGKGPNEISAPQEIKINKFNNNIYILQDYGFTIKEFDRNGNFIKIFNLPEQFFSPFDFITENKIIYIPTISKTKKKYYLNIVNLKTLKMEKKLIRIAYHPFLNDGQFFVLNKDLIWSVPRNTNNVIAYNYITGKQVERIKIKGKFKKNETTKLLNGRAIVPFIYNSAIPFFIKDNLYLLLTIRRYKDKTIKSLKNPLSIKNYIYIKREGVFVKKTYLKNCDFGEIKYILGDKLIFGFRDPYPHLKIVMIKKSFNK